MTARWVTAAAVYHLLRAVVTCACVLAAAFLLAGDMAPAGVACGAAAGAGWGAWLIGRHDG